MAKRITAMTSVPGQRSLMGLVLAASVAVSAIVNARDGKQATTTDDVELHIASDVGKGTNGKPLSSEDRKNILDDVMAVVEHRLKAKYGRPSKEPTDDEITRIIKDIEQITEKELNSKYKYLYTNAKKSIKEEILQDFQHTISNKRSAHDSEARIKQLQELSNKALEKKAQSGEPYAQYVLGARIRDTIARWKAGANSREDGKVYDADLWTGHNGEVAWKRLQKLAAEGNDYARYSMEEWVNFNGAPSKAR